MSGKAYDATVRLTDYAEAAIGTSLGPRLLHAAHVAAERSRAAAQSGEHDRLNEELEECLTAILCALAAVEAQMNEVGELVDRTWWDARKWDSLPAKWDALAKKRGVTPTPAVEAINRLNDERNLVAHFRGVPQPDGTLKVVAPPVEDRGGMSSVQAYFEAARAEQAVKDAEEAFAAL